MQDDAVRFDWLEKLPARQCHKMGMTDRISKIVGFSGWASLFIGPL